MLKTFYLINRVLKCKVWYWSSYPSCLNGNDDGALPLCQTAWTPLPPSYTSPVDAAAAAVGPVLVDSPPVPVCCPCVSEAGTCSPGSLSCAASSASRPPRRRDASPFQREVWGREEGVTGSVPAKTLADYICHMFCVQSCKTQALALSKVPARTWQNTFFYFTEWHFVRYLLHFRSFSLHSLTAILTSHFTD